MNEAGFSTLGCPGLPLDDVLTLAQRHGAELVQLRVADDEPVNVALSALERQQVRERFTAAGVKPAALATYVKLSDPDISAPLAAHVALASDLGAPALRLFPGDVDPGLGAERLCQGLRDSAGSGVALTVETHDAYLRGTQLAELLSMVDGYVGAVWDVLHTWRAGETVDETLAALRDHLAELQLKDVASTSDLRPLVPGTGVLPLREALRAARAADYRGPVIFEHEAKWHADAAAFEPSLAATMRLVHDG